MCKFAPTFSIESIASPSLNSSYIENRITITSRRTDMYAAASSFLNKNIVELSEDSATAIPLLLFVWYRRARLKYMYAEAEKSSLDSCDSSYRRHTRTSLRHASRFSYLIVGHCVGFSLVQK